MAGKLLFAKINLSKIDKTKLFTGEQGIWCDLTIWLNSEPDKYGNDMSIEQSVAKDENKIYLGNGKYYVPKEPRPATKDETDGLPF
jgi:hypothetical protein